MPMTAKKKGEEADVEGRREAEGGEEDEEEVSLATNNTAPSRVVALATAPGHRPT